jgi:tetratricopeptide (TPR) repeat protein
MAATFGWPLFFAGVSYELAAEWQTRRVSRPISPMLGHWRRAESCRACADWTGAAEGYRQILSLEPNHVPALLRLSEANEAVGDYRAALRSALMAHACRPEQPALILALSRRLLHFCEIQALLECASRPALLECREPGILAELGTALSLLGELEPASAFIARAVELVGEDAPLLYSRARICEFAGDFSGAETDLRRALEISPDDAFAHWSLSKSPDAHRSTTDIDAVRRSLRRTVVGSRNEAVMRYALFNCLDRAGDAVEAWSHLERANALTRANTPYDAADAAALFGELALWKPALYEPNTATPISDDPTPVFIVGLHRTGSSLLENLLGRHPDVANAGELYDFPAQLRWACGRYFPGALDRAALRQLKDIDFSQLGKNYRRHISWRAGGRRFVTDKLPMNFLNLGFIAQALPQAKILHTVRDPIDTCFSNLKEAIVGVAGYSYDQNEIADYYAGYRALMAHWQACLPGRILDVDYADLVTEPERALERVRTFCGLSDAPRPNSSLPSMRPVTTASSAQVRGKIHRRGLGAWKRYAPQLCPLRERLQKHGFIAP